MAAKSDGGNKNRRKVSVMFIISCIVLVPVGLLCADFFNYPSRASTSKPCCNQGENGLWLRYYWYFGKKSDNDAVETIKLLKEKQIKFAYFHVLDVTPDGDLRTKRLSSARSLIDRFHRDAPSTKIIAWVSAGDWYPAHGTDLAKPKAIDNMVAVALWLVNDCGFDGVQWDYEPCPNNSAPFEKLVQQTRTNMPANKLLSIASPMVYPSDFLKGWSASYFGRLSKHCDQIAVMGYDSGFYYPRAYQWLMSEQLALLTPAIWQVNPRCKLIIGVPTYDRDFLHDHAETLKLALIGVREGMANSRTRKEIFAGVAPFADYTTDESEWRTYRDFWLCPTKDQP